jgi:uncharacterized protein (DUF362 family)
MTRKKTVTRRRFMSTAATAGAAAVLGVRCGSEDAPRDAVTDDDGPTFDDVPQGQVVLVRGETPGAAVARGIALMNGLTFIQPGQVVMLKPNMTGPIPPPDTTSHEVLTELVRQCAAAGAGEVIVAERTYGPFDTTTVFDFPVDGTHSMRTLVEEAGATFRPLDDEPWDPFTLPGETDFDGPILIPRILTEIDHLINVPALKTHTISVFTMSIKNLFGLVHPDTRDGQVHGDPRNETDLGREKRMIAQMNLAFDPVLNVMDGIVSRTTGGPMPPGDEADTDVVLLSKDRVAMDAAGLAILRHCGTETWIEDRPVWNQVQLDEAVRLGIGVPGPDAITLVAEGVREIAEIEAKLRET